MGDVNAYLATTNTATGEEVYYSAINVGSITATNGDAINIGVSKTTSYAISGGININGNVEAAPITITGDLYALDVSG